MRIPGIVKRAEDNLRQSGVVGSIFNFFQGRATAFAIVFSIVGIVLAFMGKLDANFSLFVGSIQALVFAHSWKEDVRDQKEAELNLKRKEMDSNANSNSYTELPPSSTPPTSS